MEGKRELLYFIVKRAIASFIVILGTILIVFLISHFLNPNPAVLWAGPKAKPTTIQAVIQRYHLNAPLYTQLFLFYRDFFTGNLGMDPVTGQSISKEILFYFPNTLELVLAAMVFIIVIGVVLGYIAGVNFGSRKDTAIRLFYTSSWAAPSFLVAILAVLVFSSFVRIFPSGGMHSPYTIPLHRVTGIFVIDSLLDLNFGAFIDGIYHLILPSLVLAFLSFGLITRITRNGILSVKWLPYVKSARARGLSEKDIQRHYVLRTGLIQSNTVIAVMFSWLITGTIIIEEIFSWPGIGKFAYDAVTSDDYPALIFITITFTIFVVVVNLLADIMYAVLDPRIRLEGD